MLTGIPPFYEKKKENLFNSIRFKNPNFYDYHSKDAKSLMTLLLKKDPSKRLGALKGIYEIKNHPYFADVDWE